MCDSRCGCFLRARAQLECPFFSNSCCRQLKKNNTSSEDRALSLFVFRAKTAGPSTTELGRTGENTCAPDKKEHGFLLLTPLTDTERSSRSHYEWTCLGNRPSPATRATRTGRSLPAIFLGPPFLAASSALSCQNCERSLLTASHLDLNTKPPTRQENRQSAPSVCQTSTEASSSRLNLLRQVTRARSKAGSYGVPLAKISSFLILHLLVVLFAQQNQLKEIEYFRKVLFHSSGGSRGPTQEMTTHFAAHRDQWELRAQKSYAVIGQRWHAWILWCACCQPVCVWDRGIDRDRVRSLALQHVCSGQCVLAAPARVPTSTQTPTMATSLLMSAESLTVLAFLTSLWQFCEFWDIVRRVSRGFSRDFNWPALHPSACPQQFDFRSRRPKSLDIAAIDEYPPHRAVPRPSLRACRVSKSRICGVSEWRVTNESFLVVFRFLVESLNWIDEQEVMFDQAHTNSHLLRRSRWKVAKSDERTSHVHKHVTLILQIKDLFVEREGVSFFLQIFICAKREHDIVAVPTRRQADTEGVSQRKGPGFPSPVMAAGQAGLEP